MKNYSLYIAQDLKALHHGLISKWLDCARKTLAKQESFSCALSGGQTPHALFQELTVLADDPLWLKTHVFQVDERFVDFEDDLNNYRKLSESLLSQITIPQSHCYPMVVNAIDLPSSVKQYEQKLLSHFKLGEKTAPCFDLILLGIGGDGHTASLFPGDKLALESESWVVAVKEFYGHAQRISLTLKTINLAKNIYFLVTGEGKSDILKQVLEGEERYPSSMVEAKKGECIIFCDQAAASKLDRDNHCIINTDRDEERI